MNPQSSANPSATPEQHHSPTGETFTPTPGLERVAAVPPPAPNATLPPHLSRDDVAAAIAAMPAVGTPTASSGTLPMPAAAADEDVIEMEWVQKTEQVIGHTAGDPHAEEEAIEDLQIDYLQKRYGHNVAKPGDE